MAHKIAIIGDVNGRFEEIFQTLTKVHAKQQFAFVIIAGDLFADPGKATEDQNAQVSRLLEGSIQIPVQTYVTVAHHKLPQDVITKANADGGELCPNLIMLGRKASFKTSEGFRIVTLGGAHVSQSDQVIDQYSAQYTDSDAATAKGFNEADILITSNWPSDIAVGSKVATQPPKQLNCIAELCAALKPRYHFSTSEQFFEREPFFHPTTDGTQPLTRFLSLAPYGTPDKRKWIYAFSLEPSAGPPIQLPEGVTASPFSLGSKKRKLDSQKDAYSSHRFANGNSGHHGQEGGRRGKRRHVAPPAPSECFFCLSNPSCEQHMICSIGEDSYMTIAKGPLTTRTTFTDLNFPNHLLIMPLEHTPSISAIRDETSRRKTELEMQKLRDALHTLVSEAASAPDGSAKYGAVTFEISRAGGVHHHWQFLPVPSDMVKRGLLEAAFDVEAENLHYPKFAKKTAEVDEAEENDFFKVMIWSEALRKDMVLSIDAAQGFRFDLQFGRRVVAKLLGLESRIQWRDCSQSQQEEEADAARFRDAFAKYDFTL
ncbi:hypothetical protein K431DRAFT_47443 [Polychaeton citri CBS 116435]|uniref:CwfJ domain-containing protein n=1 Tax=Polychaeton citri CBS 116435 TaxID=1314669 RepID=A0A9P4QCP3_9PEZI|nr:hypothetical protein K431DRAFT_47443 [Polychaeton citri CBS 116435]